jgi:hypothetical protein
MLLTMKDAITEQQRKGGLARAAKYTPEQLSQQAAKAWRTRLANVRKAQTISRNNAGK